MKPVRLAIAGAGAIGSAHLERIGASSQCVACALADPAPGASDLAARAGLPLYRTPADLLAAQRPDGVILATPNALHVAGALECIAAGVPCLVEKPVADSLAEAQRLRAAVTASGVPMLVGHHRRHSAVIQRAAEIVQSGVLGRMVAVMASATFVKPASYLSAGPWRAQPGGGPILLNLIHEIDNLRLLVGDIDAVQAFASNAARGFAVEDTVAISLRFANGALGTFLLSDAAASPRSWEQTTGENIAYDRHADMDCYVLAGTRGSLAVPTMRLQNYEGEASWWAPLTTTRLAVEPADPLERQLAHFCGVVRGEVAPLVSVDDAARTLAVTLAVAHAKTQVLIAAPDWRIVMDLSDFIYLELPVRHCGCCRRTMRLSNAIKNSRTAATPSQ